MSSGAAAINTATFQCLLFIAVLFTAVFATCCCSRSATESSHASCCACLRASLLLSAKRCCGSVFEPVVATFAIAACSGFGNSLALCGMGSAGSWLLSGIYVVGRLELLCPGLVLCSSGQTRCIDLFPACRLRLNCSLDTRPHSRFACLVCPSCGRVQVVRVGRHSWASAANKSFPCANP